VEGDDDRPADRRIPQIASAFGDSKARFDRIASAFASSNHTRERLQRMADEVEKLPAKAKPPPASRVRLFDESNLVPTIPPKPEPGLLRDLLSVQREQFGVLQSLADAQAAAETRAAEAEARAAERHDQTHRVTRAGAVAAVQATVLTVAFSSGQFEGADPRVLIGVGTGAVALVVASWADWRPARQRMRHLRQGTRPDSNAPPRP
jgi:hypothetical protein